MRLLSVFGCTPTLEFEVRLQPPEVLEAVTNVVVDGHDQHLSGKFEVLMAGFGFVGCQFPGQPCCTSCSTAFPTLFDGAVLYSDIVHFLCVARRNVHVANFCVIVT